MQLLVSELEEGMGDEGKDWRGLIEYRFDPVGQNVLY